MKAGIVGATGYLGAELLRHLANHPNLEVAAVQADSSAGRTLGAAYPGLGAPLADLMVTPFALDALLACDVVFVSVPSGASQKIVPQLVDRVRLTVDLGADFRLRDAKAYEEWYGFTHEAPELLSRSVYGLVEHEREALRSATFIASPGCYVTAAAVAIEPLVKSGAIASRGILVDAASGTSGGGKEPKPAFHHAAVNENFVAYAAGTHRHTPEIEQATGAEVLFVPHLLPVTRGILATIYAKPTGSTSTKAVLEALRERYRGEPFVHVTPELPSTRDTYGSNNVHLGARYDARTDTVVLFSALDNLTKGGAGQALQAANVALGFEEAAGLPNGALLP